MNFRFSLSCLLLLAAGCRSPQAAFRFAPAPIQAAAVVAPTEAPIRPVAPVVGQVAAVNLPTQHRSATLPSRPVRAVAVRTPRMQPAAAVETAAHRPLWARRQLLKPQQALLEHPGAFVLGTVLVVGGVVAGLLLGGWLGLGVGALVVLGGYYFLGVGLGGEHAWLEVFQEFFNM